MSGYWSHLEPFTPGLEMATGMASLLGLLAPTGIALFFILSDKGLKKDLAGRLFGFKTFRIRFLLISLLLMPASILLAQLISLWFGCSSEQFSLRGGFTFSSSLFPVWFLLLAAPVFEELAWHSYGMDSLLSRYHLLKASLLFALFWAFWHLPLSTIKGYYHSNLVASEWIYSLNFLLSMIPFVILMNWIYYKANRNVLLTIIFHITAVFFNEIFMTHPMSKVIQTVLLLLLSTWILWKEKDLFFGPIPVLSGIK